MLPLSAWLGAAARHFCLTAVPAPRRHYPQDITVASFEFKHQRFANMHRVSLRWPLQRFRFLGTPALSEAALQARTVVMH